MSGPSPPPRPLPLLAVVGASTPPSPYAPFQQQQHSHPNQWSSPSFLRSFSSPFPTTFAACNESVQRDQYTNSIEDDDKEVLVGRSAQVLLASAGCGPPHEHQRYYHRGNFESGSAPHSRMDVVHETDRRSRDSINDNGNGSVCNCSWGVVERATASDGENEADQEEEDEDEYDDESSNWSCEAALDLTLKKKKVDEDALYVEPDHRKHEEDTSQTTCSADPSSGCPWTNTETTSTPMITTTTTTAIPKAISAARLGKGRRMGKDDVERDGRKKEDEEVQQSAKTKASSSELDEFLTANSRTLIGSFRCKICGKTLLSLDALSAHLQLHCSADGFTCPVCDRVFQKKNSLKGHLKLHEGRDVYPCEYCSKVFPYRSKLEIHVRKHTGEKPYPCGICARRFSTNSELRVHLRVHANDRRFVCPVCAHRCLTKSALSVHLRHHTGEKPYVCHVCGEAFMSLCRLKTHKLRVHHHEHNHLPNQFDDANDQEATAVAAAAAAAAVSSGCATKNDAK